MSANLSSYGIIAGKPPFSDVANKSDAGGSPTRTRTGRIQRIESKDNRGGTHSKRERVI
jgi:hypothetical protein